MSSPCGIKHSQPRTTGVSGAGTEQRLIQVPQRDPVTSNVYLESFCPGVAYRVRGLKTQDIHLLYAFLS